MYSTKFHPEFNVSEHWLRTGEGDMFNNDTTAQMAKMITLFKALDPQFQVCALMQLEQLTDLYSIVKNTNS